MLLTKRVAFILLFILILASLLAVVPACVDNPPVVDKTTQELKLQGGPVGGGSLRVYGGVPSTLDVALVGDINSYQYISQIFSGLVTVDERLEIVPDVAEKWTLGPDGRVYTFQLRQGVRFHDGSPVTAQDFKYSIERAADPKTGSTAASTYLGDIVGVSDKLAGKAIEVSGVRVKGDYTLEIEIDAPKAFFLSKLTYPTAFVLDRKNVEGSRDWQQHPNGSGSFKLKSWDPEKGIVLERNDDYYGTKPNLKEVLFYLGGGSPMNVYELNEVDVIEVGLAEIDRVLDKHNPLNKELQVAPQLSLTYIGFNTKMEPFDDPKVRQAFAYATDKDKLVNVLFKNTRRKASGILPPGLPGHDPSYSGVEFNPARAQELLAGSRYGGAANLPEITFTVGGGSSVALALVDMYKRNLGVTVNVEQAEDGYVEGLEGRQFQMFEMGWIADYPDPQDFLDIFFHSGSYNNYMSYASKDVDGLLESARVELNEDKRFQLYRAAEQLVVADASAIPIYHDITYALVKPYVKGFSISPLGIISLKNVRIEK